MSRSLIASALVLAACARRPAEAPSIPRSDVPGGIAPGDMLHVAVLHERAPSGPRRVAADGAIDVPLCGTIRVAGLDDRAAALAIERCLKTGFFAHPVVHVTTIEHERSVLVLGAIAIPARVTLEDGETLLHAILRAGGFRPEADVHHVVLRRAMRDGEKRYMIDADAIARGERADVPLDAGDVVMVAERID